VKKVFILLLFFTSISLWSEFYELPDEKGFLYPPEDWFLQSEESGAISFMESNREAVFQIMTFSKDEYNSSREIATRLFSELDIIDREESSFLFLGSEAIRGDVTFVSAGRENRGCFLFYTGKDYHYYLVAMAPLENYEKQRDSMLSFLDSFSPSKEGLSSPGPISQFEEPFPSPVKRIGITKAGVLSPFFDGDKQIFFKMGPGAGEAVQKTIEREARILVDKYPETVNLLAWERYYQIIMRETHGRLASFHDAISPGLQGLTSREKVEILLNWVQEFTYQREENSLSDLLSPVTAVLENRGDCDARALILISLLSYENIPGLLMVSQTYKHALAAFDVDGSGARFPHETLPGGYVVAETTDSVALGMIDSSMADPAQWLGIPTPYSVAK